MYAKHIQKKKFSWGGVGLATRFPAHGVISIVGSVAGGSRAWKHDIEAQMHAAMLLEGTHTRSKKDIQILLDSIGASLSFSADDDRLIFNGKVRAPHLAQLLSLIAEILQDAAFPETELAVLKNREIASLALEAQDTRTQSRIALSQLLFDSTHPNYSESTAVSKSALERVTAHVLRERHKQLLDRRTLVCSVAGDIDPKKTFALIERYFKMLPEHAVALPKFSKTVPQKAKKQTVLIPHKASIDYMCGIVTGKTDAAPEYAALLLGMQILGNTSGFTGRLMRTVREQEGLTYGIYAYTSGFDSTTDGYLVVWATFAPQLFKQGRAATWREIRHIIKNGVTTQEVRKHAELFAARRTVQLSNTGAFARAAHDLIIDDKPLAYLDTFPKTILKLSAAQVHKALKKYLVLEKLSESAAGAVSKDSLQ